MAAVTGRIFAQNDSLLCCLNGIGVLGNLIACGLSILFQAQLSIYVAVACAISHGVFLIIEYKWIRLLVSVVVLGSGIAELVLIHGQYEFQFADNLWIIGDLINGLAEGLALIPQVMGYINIVVGVYMFLIAYTEVLCGGGGGTTTNNSNVYYFFDNPNQLNQLNQLKPRAILRESGQPLQPVHSLDAPIESDESKLTELPLLLMTV